MSLDALIELERQIIRLASVVPVLSKFSVETAHVAARW